MTGVQTCALPILKIEQPILRIEYKEEFKKQIAIDPGYYNMYFLKGVNDLLPKRVFIVILDFGSSKNDNSLRIQGSDRIVSLYIISKIHMTIICKDRYKDYLTYFDSKYIKKDVFSAIDESKEEEFNGAVNKIKEIILLKEKPKDSASNDLKYLLWFIYDIENEDIFDNCIDSISKSPKNNFIIMSEKYDFKKIKEINKKYEEIYKRICAEQPNLFKNYKPLLNEYVPENDYTKENFLNSIIKLYCLGYPNDYEVKEDLKDEKEILAIIKYQVLKMVAHKEIMEKPFNPSEKIEYIKSRNRLRNTTTTKKFVFEKEIKAEEDIIYLMMDMQIYIKNADFENLRKCMIDMIETILFCINEWMERKLNIKENKLLLLLSSIRCIYTMIFILAEPPNFNNEDDDKVPKNEYLP